MTVRPDQLNFLMFGFAGPILSLTKNDVHTRNDIMFAVK